MDWWALNSVKLTYNVGLLNLLSPDAFSGGKMVNNASAAGAVPDPIGEVYSAPQIPYLD